jgi:hypothetical protein
MERESGETPWTSRPRTSVGARRRRVAAPGRGWSAATAASAARVGAAAAAAPAAPAAPGTSDGAGTRRCRDAALGQRAAPPCSAASQVKTLAGSGSFGCADGTGRDAELVPRPASRTTSRRRRRTWRTPETGFDPDHPPSAAARRGVARWSGSSHLQRVRRVRRSRSGGGHGCDVGWRRWRRCWRRAGAAGRAAPRPRIRRPFKSFRRRRPSRARAPRRRRRRRPSRA